MRRIFVYFISLLIILSSSMDRVIAQDTIQFPLKINIGLEVAGPVIYLIENNNLKVEGFLSFDINEKVAPYLALGYTDYKYSQYNYNYLNNGYFIRTGVDFNLLNPEKSSGKYWVGIGLRYGLSFFTTEYPLFLQDSYWGIKTSSIAKDSFTGHFFEISPGARAEIFKNFSIGWSISMKILLHAGTGKDMKPIYFPGFGNATKTISPGLSYNIVWHIPYKKKNVIIKVPPPEEPEEPNNTPVNNQQSSGIRQ